MADDLKQDRKKLVFLAGFMGSGKSTVGPILANTLGFDFVDVDKVIEEQIGKSILEIFAEHGESTFREWERGALQQVMSKDQCVISLGGGTIANKVNFDLIQKNGIIVYLALSPKGILDRVRHKSHRPMLKDSQGNPLSEIELQGRIEELLGVREKFYEQSHLIISTEKKNVGATVDEIVRKLRGRI